ncbi:hypothetical protein K503DRAFT_515103 [Rhizopogon vinicolor AM-OR11-026]|uniref:Uncharacterized protein n=1 Tax=Rhizopogon vinicolor AM-OR11-026 TaxID=1314800 RepID=A0A1B7MLU2_9AGAM|nr:hypothetical protein K503DRAFT_515103 [Rhizopogon vinicolor AM-OR11-026]
MKLEPIRFSAHQYHPNADIDSALLPCIAVNSKNHRPVSGGHRWELRSFVIVVIVIVVVFTKITEKNCRQRT